MYADRLNLDVWFSPPIALDVSDVPDPFLTDDCTRLYFNAFGSVTFFREL
jgi:hypothetical protein